jgi:hypothetical protein
MRVGVITLHFADSYGGVLQAYALQTYLQGLGHEVQIIDYRPRYMTRGGRLRLPLSRKDVFANAEVALVRASRLRTALTGRKRRRAFRAFREDMLALGSRRYSTLEALRADPPACDAYVCGSDQIWNHPLRAGVDPAYYLAFGDRQCRRLAYAASFGRRGVEEEHAEQIGRLLGGLDHISVREESGAELVRRLAGRPAAWLPDPTLLMDDYAAVCDDASHGDYVFAHCLRSNAAMAAVQGDLARACDAPVVTPYDPRRRWRSRAEVVQMGPAEWLGYVAGARMVLTNSLHGTLFSIVLRKPFIAVPLLGRKADLSERLRSALGRLGLTDRLLEGTDSEDVQRLLDTPVDWEGAYGRLRPWREEAHGFLTKALE